MSVINKMLQDLDHRHAMAGADQAILPRHVRAVEGARTGHEWFWRVIAALMLVAVACVAWIMYQLRPPQPPLVTELAFRAAEEAKSRRIVSAPAPPAAVTVAPAPEPAKTVVQSETMKLAQSIDSPINERAPNAVSPARPQPAAVEDGLKPPAKSGPVAAARPPASIALDVPPARVLQAPQVAPVHVEKRDRVRTPAERAEAEYRRAVTLLNQGRASEAEEELGTVLAHDPAHEAARQVLAALLLEKRDLDGARRVLQEGLAINPAQSTFAIALARIFVERRDLPAAMAVLDAASAGAAANADFHAMRANVLQRLGRHREAAEAYQSALRIQATSPQAWIGLGISLEALAQRPEAADAFRRALAAGPVSAELKSFAEQRVRALQ